MMRLASLGLATACLLAPSTRAHAQSSTPSPVGMWRGTSTCLVRPSACRDEVVVYRITRAGASDSLALDGRKVLNGNEEAMGVLACAFTTADATITCSIPPGTWRFRIRGDSLIGDLTLTTGAKSRDVRTARSR